MASAYRVYASPCKVHTDSMYPCKNLKIRSMLCCYFWKQYLTVFVLIPPYIDRFEIFIVPVVYNSRLKFVKKTQYKE